jgi:hypothetical protein
MIWHIFKKDWKLLWPMIIGVAIVNALYRVNRSTLGLFENHSSLSNMSYLFSEVTLLVTGVLIIIVVQLDAIPGLRQDWLVRPVRRTDLLLSKFALVVLLIQFPIFIMEVIQGLAAGFPLGQSLSAPLSRSLWMLLAMDLPLLAFATLTRNITEAIGAAVAVVLAVAVFNTSTLRVDFIQFPSRTNFSWVVDLIQLLWALLAAIVILAVQYYRRRTFSARLISATAIGAWLFLSLVPWQVAFALGKQVSSQPSAVNGVQLTLGPPLRIQRPPMPGRPLHQSPQRSGYVTLLLPVSASDTGQGQMLLIDHSEVHLGESALWQEQRPGDSLHGSLRVLYVPRDLYNRVGNQPERLEMNYSLTLLKADPPRPIPAVDGYRRTPGVGTCATKMRYVEGLIELGCITVGNPPCATYFLQNPRTGKTNGEQDSCFPNYSPWFGRFEGDSMSRFGHDLHFRDMPDDYIRHPVNETQIQEAEVMIRVFHPKAHFERQLVIPQFTMSEWVD